MLYQLLDKLQAFKITFSPLLFKDIRNPTSLYSILIKLACWGVLFKLNFFLNSKLQIWMALDENSRSYY